MNHKQDDYKVNQNETIFIEMTGWALHYRPDKVSQPWSILCTYDNKLSAIIKANQISGEYFMVKVTDPGGSITWSN
ncbi:MAG: hypothetical protein GQ572_02645 [Gammaproteobacteria bacterium]|jgi:hypothetical protein|nr:hypothetical protein [Gammaproteobacteria bacterium]